MIGATAFGIFLTPVFYYVITRPKKKTPPAKNAPSAEFANGEMMQAKPVESVS